MSPALTLYGRILNENKGQLPASLAGFNEAQLCEVVTSLLDAWEALSLLTCLLPTGLSLSPRGIERWRSRSGVDTEETKLPIEMIEHADLSTPAQTVEGECVIEWGDVAHARPVSQAPRDVLEAEVRSLHGGLVYLKRVVSVQTKLVTRILSGHAVTESGLTAWEESVSPSAA